MKKLLTGFSITEAPEQPERFRQLSGLATDPDASADNREAAGHDLFLEFPAFCENDECTLP
jgi:hypothetical protein